MACGVETEGGCRDDGRTTKVFHALKEGKSDDCKVGNHHELVSSVDWRADCCTVIGSVF